MSAITRPVVAPPSNAHSHFARKLVHGMPTIAVFTLLAGVLYLGHHTGWKLPKFSHLFGAANGEADDWCEEHLVPESVCVECKPGLLPKHKPFGFCKEHGVAECVLHHPELAQIGGEVQLPKYDMLKAISVVSRPENNSRNTLHLSRVQFTSADAVTKAGVDVDVVQERPMMEAVLANGELKFNPTRVAHLSSRVPGTVALVLKSIGDEVKAGEIVAIVDSSQVGQAKSHLLQTAVQLQLRKNTIQRLEKLSSGGAIPQKSLIDAEAALQESEIAFVSAKQSLANLGLGLPDQLDVQNSERAADQLRFLGISESLKSILPNETKTANLLPIRAPYDGVVMNSDVIAGEVVDTANLLFTIADPSQLWLTLNVRQEDAKYVSLALPVMFRPDDGTSEVNGKISWISPAVDDQTRTLQVRVAVDNSDQRLRDKTFGTGRIILRQEPNAVTVPKEAVQSTSDAHFVFVRDKRYFEEDAPKIFHVRQIRIGAKTDQHVELLAGVLPGEVVATKGSAVLLAQLLRSNLGAGCGCHEH